MSDELKSSGTADGTADDKLIHFAELRALVMLVDELSVRTENFERQREALLSHDSDRRIKDRRIWIRRSVQRWGEERRQVERRVAPGNS